MWADTLAAVLQGFAISQQAWPLQKYHTENFDGPGIKLLTNTNPGDGYLFYGIFGRGYISPSPIIMENSGELIWRGPQTTTHNFQVQTWEDQDYLTWWEGFGDHFGHGYGHITFADNTYKTVKKLCLKVPIVTPNPSSFPGNRRDPCYFDSHEIYVTPQGTVVSTVFNVTRADLSQFGGPKDGWIFDALIYELNIQTGDILFHWSALEHVPITESNFFGDDPNDPLVIGGKRYGSDQSLPWDFFHMNSVQLIEGAYYVSSRMTWSVYKVNARDGHIEWRMQGCHGGDFSLAPDIFWSWQHMPRLQGKLGDDLLISLFNNDNINRIVQEVNQTSGYLLRVNEKDKKVSAERDLRDPSDTLYVQAEGSYQALSNGHVLMGFGAEAVIKEFDKHNKVVYNMQFAPLDKIDPDQDNGKDVHSYRAFRLKWEANPADPPKAAALAVGDKHLRVYMSWNGATGVQSWNIYGGNSRNSLIKIASGIERTGFETEALLQVHPKQYKYIQVEAISSKIAPRKSEIARVGENA